MFATRAWQPFEILGEREARVELLSARQTVRDCPRARYVGVVKAPEVEGSYVVALESDVPHSESLSLDAEVEGNELRFVNDFRGIGVAANVSFQQATIRSLPAQMLVVTRPVQTGEELLTDYGEDYWRATLGYVPKLHELEEPPAPEAPAAAPRRPPSVSSDDEDDVTRAFMMAGLDSDGEDPAPPTPPPT